MKNNNSVVNRTPQGWSWIPFIILIITEKSLAAASKVFRVATVEGKSVLGTAPLTEPGSYVVYNHDRSPGNGTNQRLVRPLVSNVDNTLSFLGFGRAEDDSNEKATVFTCANAEMISRATFEWTPTTAVADLFKESAANQMYPWINSKGEMNKPMETALRFFSYQGLLFHEATTNTFKDQNGKPVTGSNVTEWLSVFAPTSLLARILNVRPAQVKTYTDKKETTSNAVTNELPVVLDKSWFE